VEVRQLFNWYSTRVPCVAATLGCNVPMEVLHELIDCLHIDVLLFPWGC
jgi:hypothetical protein